uniref:Phasin family protein n=2 Tax=unclassified Candidatus Kentrum TaxID=2643149 RepID=A0A451APB9_9GAMM|nr:MAG: phasin family protein [Candidatus Kentron sp. LPFa]VFK18007.1 MAG: phasin family protein [Candidatus Kentron sp. LPFa]VFK33951.1 MAG: phasin family protein [Candidatus Kentron sp. LPFa]VFK67934.1 MAG: phasin family protein [Candidatus Kentron sp. UNK]VFK73234.1 MAG: phasin family protein [Candidatus Kentron sp. UNK]
MATTQSKDSNMPGAFDFAKIMADLEPNKMMEQFSKILQDYKVPGVDTTAILESSRKNIEALVAANRQAAEGLQAVVSRQGEILRETANETASVLKQLSSGENPKDVVSKQMELLNPALERVLSNARELAEMVQKSNTDAFDIIKKRFEESLSEFKSIAKQKP